MYKIIILNQSQCNWKNLALEYDNRGSSIKTTCAP